MKWYRHITVCFLNLYLSSVLFAINNKPISNIRYTEIGHVFSFCLDGGVSLCQYPETGLTKKKGITGGIHVEYAFFCNKFLGFAVDLGSFRWNNEISLFDKTYTWNNVYDTEGESYDHNVYLHSIKEQLTTYYIDIPLKIELMLPLSKVGALLSFGASPALPVYNTSKTQASLEHVGYYSQYGMIIDVPKFGFYKSNNFRQSYQNLKVGFQVFALASLDFIISLKDEVELFLGAEIRYGTLNMYRKTHKETIGFRNDSPQGDIYHPFMNNYSSLIKTTEVSNKLHPYTLSLRLGMRFNHYGIRKNGYAK